MLIDDPFAQTIADPDDADLAHVFQGVRDLADHAVNVLGLDRETALRAMMSGLACELEEEHGKAVAVELLHDLADRLHIGPECPPRDRMVN